MKSVGWLVAAALCASVSGVARAADDPSSLMLQEYRPTFSPKPKPDLSNRIGPDSPEVRACVNADRKTSPETRIAKCTVFIDKSPEKGKNVGWAYANRCIAQLALKQVDKALADCNAAIENDPEDINAYRVRAGIRRSRGENDGAVADFDKAEAGGVKDVWLNLQRGDILLARGDVDRAIADFNRAAVLDDKIPAIFADRAAAELSKGDIEKARTDFAQVERMGSGLAIGAFGLGVTDFLAGDKAKAAEKFRQTLKADATNAYAALWLFAALEGSPDAVAELNSNLKALNPAIWPAPVAKFYLGEIDAAAAVAAAKTANDRCEAQYYIGRQALLKGSRDQAADGFRKAVATCPKNFFEYIIGAAELKKLDAK